MAEGQVCPESEKGIGHKEKKGEKKHDISFLTMFA